MPESTSSHANTTNLIATAALIGVSMIICACIGAYTVQSVKSQGQTIRVTGAAYKPIRSDLAVWTAVISASASTMEGGYTQLVADVNALKAFLQEQGYSGADYSLTPVSIREVFNRERVVTGFNLTRSVRLEHSDVTAISDLAGEASRLIEQGVMIQSRPITYLFTVLDSLKLEMIQSATENAKKRAERLANATGQEVGAPISAKVGVFQIRALRSQEVSSRGISDVSSIDKEIVSTVHIDFVID